MIINFICERIYINLATDFSFEVIHEFTEGRYNEWGTSHYGLKFRIGNGNNQKLFFKNHQILDLVYERIMKSLELKIHKLDIDTNLLSKELDGVRL